MTSILRPQLLTKLLTGLLCLVMGSALAQDADHAVILLYHHVSEETPASTSVSPEQFRQHLNYLKQNNYRVVALDELLEKLLAGKQVAENSVAITFDDAYESIYSRALPMLEEYGWPFTVFLASEPLDQKIGGYMSWQQARELGRRGASFGAHSVTHDYLARRRQDEPESEWLQRVAWEIDENRVRIEAELGVDVKSFAYPFGEYNAAMKTLLQARNLYGLAQQSGALGHYTEALQIPRFPMATGYDDLARFKVAIDSRSLPVMNERVQPASPKGEELILKLAAGEYRAAALACYAASGDRLQLTLRAPLTYSVQLPATRPGRNKINCTAPSTEAGGEFFWHSYLWLDY